jgi:hypothetical protein
MDDINIGSIRGKATAMDSLQTGYPEYTALLVPKPEEITVYRVLPKVISALNYSPRSAHSDLAAI